MHPHPTRGHTLIELLIVLALVTTLLGVAAPSFHAGLKQQQLRVAVNDLLGAIGPAERSRLAGLAQV